MDWHEGVPLPTQIDHPAQWNDEETRSEQDTELQRARDTMVSLSPKVFFRRVKYDINEAQQRFFAIADLPRYNGLRLALGK